MSRSDIVVDEYLPYEGIELGTPVYDAGLEPAHAYSVGAVFRWGLSGLQEYPLLSVLAGVNFFLISMVPQFLSVPIEVFMEFASLSGEIGEMETELIKSALQILIGLVLFPFQQLVVAGAYVSLANAIRNDESRVSWLYTSIRPAINVLLYTVLTALIGLLVAGVVLGPGFAVGIACIIAGDPVFLVAGVAVFLATFVVWIPLMIYVSLGLQLGVFAASIDNRMPMDALRISWSMARGARRQLFLTNAAFGILATAGMCACFLPSLLVYAMQLVGFTAAWLKVSRSLEVTDQWDFFQLSDG